MEELGKSPESCFAGYLLALMELHEGENGDEFSPEAEITEEMVVEVMQELLKEINTCCEVKTSPPLTIFPATMSSSSFVVSGDNERCGPSFSNSASTVMAGVGMGPTKALAGDDEEGFPAAGGEEKMDGCDDDEWLERVLSMDPQEFEDLMDDDYCIGA